MSSTTPAELKVTNEPITKNKQTRKKQLVEERKQKRSIKAEAKKVRRGNVKPAGKWTEERKAESKAKKLARPANQEKKKQRLKDRAQRLESKAQQLLAEAKKAAAQYQALLDAEKEGKTGAEDNEDDSDASSVASNDSDATSSSGSSEDEGGAPTGTTEIDDASSKIPADEVILKRRRLSNASQRSVASTNEAAKAEDKTSKKSKKKNKDTATETEAQDEKQEVIEEGTKKSKKAEKKRKRTSDAAETEEPSVKKDKKDKKEKKAKGNKPAKEKSSAVNEEGEQWQVEDLDGGAARQTKFMRLLGGKKAGATGVGAASHVSKGKSDSTKAEADIQRQFEMGMKMKADGGSKRRGLGA